MVVFFRRQITVMISVVDTEENLAKALNEIEGDDAGRNHRAFRRGGDPAGAQQGNGDFGCEPVSAPSCCGCISATATATKGKLLYEAIVNRCKELKIAGATVFRGLEGYGESAGIHRPHVMRKDQPIVVTIVDTPENLARLIPEVEQMMDTGMIATSDVDYMRIEKPPAGGK